MALFPDQQIIGIASPGGAGGVGTTTYLDNLGNRTQNPNPYGFIGSEGPSTQATVPYYNTKTGENWTAPTGGYTPPSADWVQGTRPINFAPPRVPYNANFNTNPSGPGGLMGLFNSPGLKGVPETSNQQTISPYAQPYIADLLGKAQAFTSAPMPAYEGQLTAGYSPLQEQAYAGLANLTLPSSLETAGSELQNISQKQQGLSFSPTDISTSAFNQQAAQQYMNPYIQSALNPQLEALKRQSDINRQGELAKLTQAGAYGGSREAVLRGQQDYNLLQQQAGLIGSGYNQAYNQAAQQFNADQARNLQAQQLTQQGKQFGATYGLQGLQAAATAQQAAANAGASAAQYGLGSLQALSKAGTEQQAIGQQALNAQYNEYLRQLQYPQTMLKLQRDVITGLPMTTTQTFQAQKSAAQSAAGAADTVIGMVDKFKKMGMSMPDISKYINQLTKTNPVQTGGITMDENGKFIYPTSPDGVTPYDEEGNLMPGFGLTEDNNPVWIGSDYIDPSIANPDPYYGYDDYDYGYNNPDDYGSYDMYQP